MKRSPYYLSILLLSVVSTPIFSQDNTCEIPEIEDQFSYTPPGSGVAERFPINTQGQGSINVLIIPVQHQDEDFEHCGQILGGVNQTSGKPNMGSGQPHSTNCVNRTGEGWTIGDYQSGSDHSSIEWPADLPDLDKSGHQRQRPAWMGGLIDAPGTSTITPGSLTDYYHQMSNGRFNLRGAVLDYVVIPDNPIQHYIDISDSGGNGAITLSQEIISYAINQPGSLDLTDQSIWDTYTNGSGDTRVADDRFDMIVLLFRSSHLAEINPLPALNANNYTSLGSDSQTTFSLGISAGNMDIVDGVIGGSGVSTQALSKKAALRIIAHEIGHRQYGLYHTDPRNGNSFSTSDYFSIMNGSAHLGFGAADRVKIGWANVQYEDINSISDQKTITLRNASVVSTSENDVVWIRDGSSSSCGDIVIESRMWSNFWDSPPGAGNDDGDEFDFYLPNEGLYIWKAADGSSCGGFNANYSSVPNSTLHTRWKYFGTNGDYPGFGPGDAYLPEFVQNDIVYNVHSNSTLDNAVGITNIEKVGNSYQFTIHSDYGGSRVLSGQAIDTYIKEDDGNYHDTATELLIANPSPPDVLNLGVPDDGNKYLSLLKWDLSSIPTTARVRSVKLRFEVSDVTNDKGYTIHEVLKNWVADETNWTHYASGSEWSAEGASSSSDRSLAEMAFLDPRSANEYEISLNEEGINVVQGWIDNPSLNYGIAITKLGINPDGFSFFAEDYISANPKPTLEVNYDQEIVNPTASLTTFLAGPYNTGSMNTDLEAGDYIPHLQPYGANPWNYGGIEYAPVFANDIVDWVLVELATGDPANPPLTIKAQQAGLLKSNGVIVNDEGDPFVFENLLADDYYVIIRHRNHLDIMSDTKVSVTGNFSFDFTSGLAFSQGGAAMIQLGTQPDVYGMWGGDGDANGSVTAFDHLNTWLPINGYSDLYDAGDFNMDSHGTAFDYLTVWLPANGQDSQVPATTTGGSSPSMKQGYAEEAIANSSIRGRLQAHSLRNGKVELTIAFKAEEATKLGTSTFRIGYDPAAVRFPFRPTDNEQGDYSYSRFHNRQNAKYTSTVTHPLPGIVSVNIALLERGRGTDVEQSEFREALKIWFDVVDPGREPNFTWLRCEVSDGEYRALTNTCSSLGQSDMVEVSNLRADPKDDTSLDSEFELGDAYPNPFNPQSHFTLRVAEEQQVSIEIFDVTGRLVKMLHSGILSAQEEHRFTINGSALPSGTYFYRVAGDNFQEIRHVVLLK